MARAAAAAIAFAAVVLVGACSGINVQNEVYQTLDEARAAGAIEAGWVPSGLPPSTTDVRAAHLPDGQRWGAFTFAPSHGPTLKALLGEELTSGVTCDAPARLEWWPRILRSPIDLERVHSTGFRAYRDRSSGFRYAINWPQGRAYYWKD